MLCLLQINDRYEFPDELDLDVDNGKFLAPEADRSVRNLYKLHSVLVHSGGVHGGHYYAYIRPASKQWLKFDDEKVQSHMLTCDFHASALLLCIATCSGLGQLVSAFSYALCVLQCAKDSRPKCCFSVQDVLDVRSTVIPMQVYKEPSKRALDEQFGGEDETPPPAPGFTSPTLKLTKYSNAYMLVYVRESSWKDIMLDVSQNDIAEHVRSRLKVTVLLVCFALLKHTAMHNCGNGRAGPGVT